MPFKRQIDIPCREALTLSQRADVLYKKASVYYKDFDKASAPTKNKKDILRGKALAHRKQK